jgi:hypothetical protein
MPATRLTHRGPGQNAGMLWITKTTGRRAQVGCAPGCLIWSIVLSIALTVLLNVLIRLF